MRRRPLLAIGTLAGFAFAIWLPIDRNLDNDRAIAALRAEEARLSAELADRQAEVLEVLGPAKTEALARQRLGMVRPGERAYVLPETEPEPVRPEIVEAEPSGDSPWWSQTAGALWRTMRSLI